MGKPGLVRSVAEGRHHGQALIIVALSLCFVLVGVTAVGIDGANYILKRRNLQHAADAAALGALQRLSEGGTTADAFAVAQSYAISNTTPLTITALTPNVGTGDGLTNGVEIGGQEVRVALNQPIPTFFTGILGFDTLLVSAHARARTSDQGLLPIAVRRYNASANPQTDFVARSTTPWGYENHSNYCTVNNWSKPNYPGQFMTVWVPNASYEAAETAPGPEAPILGAGVTTNNGVASFNGFINLDIRHIGTPPAEYYSGVYPGINPQTLKDLEGSYIATGYRNPNKPKIGDQVAILEGVSNADTAHVVHEFYQAGYTAGSVIPVIIYDGIVWDRPGYTLEVYPSGQPSDNINAVPVSRTTSVAYDIKITPDPQTPTPLQANLSYSIMNHYTSTVEINLSPTTVSIPAGGVTLPGALTVHQENGADPPVVAVLTIKAVESSTQVTKWQSVTYRSDSTPQDYTIYANPKEITIDRGGGHGATIDLTFQGVNGYTANNKPIDSNVVGQSGMPSGWFNTSWHPPSQKVDIKTNKTSGSLTLSGTENANTGSYTLRIYFDDDHYANVAMSILGPWVDPTWDKYIVVQGYSLFKITQFTPSNQPNEVDGYAVGPLVEHFQDLPVRGRSVRLTDWIN